MYFTHTIPPKKKTLDSILTSAKNSSVQFLIYFHAKLSTQMPITKQARVRNVKREETNKPNIKLASLI
jgi:hypothetical protein